MNEEALERVASSRVTRRTIVTTGTKLAYAAPLVAASFKLSGAGVLAQDVELPIIACYDPANAYCPGDWPGATDVQCKVVICHRTCSETNPYVAIEIPSDCNQTPEEALAAHLEHHQDNGCDVPDVFPSNIDATKHTAICPGGGVGGPSPVR